MSVDHDVDAVIIKRFGFLPVLHLSPLSNAVLLLGKTNAWEFTNTPSSMVFHDLTTGHVCPPDCKQLLGLGSKFVILPEMSTDDPSIQHSFERFDRDIQVKAFFAGQGDITEDGDSKLFIKSVWLPPDGSFPKEFSRRLIAFQAQVSSQFSARKCQTNLSPPQLRLLNDFKQDHSIITVNTDKGLGIARIEYEKYIKDAFKFHFNDKSTYKYLSAAEAAEEAALIMDLIDDWLMRHQVSLGKKVCEYIRHHVGACKHPFPFFYQLYKIHKQPVKTRPVISGCGSLLHSIGHWIDEQLQPIARKMPAYFKSSYILKEELITLSLPPNAVLFTADAVSMYTNIDTDHALKIIGEYIENNRCTSHKEALIEALYLVMRNLICVFGDLHFRQVKGTAMGTPPAPPWATIYYGIHELKFLEKYAANLKLYKRFIDDILGIWLPHHDPLIDAQLWAEFQADVQDGGLEWDFSDRGNQVVFMDLTISIVGDHIETTLFEKSLALYQYIPPSSAHPPGLLNGLVIGQVLRFHQLCTSISDVHDKMRLLHRRLMQRGYSEVKLFPYFLQGLAVARRFLALPLEQRLESKKLPRPDPSLIFFHLKFHSQDPISSSIQALWRETVLEPTDRQPFNELLNCWGFPIGIKRLVVAYSRHLNLGNTLSIRRFDRLKGPAVSSFNLHE